MPKAHPTPALRDVPCLLRIAQNQRGIMLCILANVLLFCLTAALQLGVVTAGIATLLVSLASAVFLVRLAAAAFSGTVAIICGVLIAVANLSSILGTPMLAYLVMLPLLLVVNARATRELRAAGFHVGLLGGSPAEVLARTGGTANPRRPARRRLKKRRAPRSRDRSGLAPQAQLEKNETN